LRAEAIAQRLSISALGRVLLVLLFGLVLIYVPVRLVAAVERPARIGLFQAAGMLIGAAGGALALWCVSSFALAGRGTPVPFAAPRRLVTGGPYRFVRNPMYIGAGLLFAGAAVFYESRLLAGYVIAFALAGHLFVVWYEEPTLRRMFAREYAVYSTRVGRWWPSVSRRPDRGGARTT
jgi:protein-S-isoprenylcysteine O-methyltransferase Ste14